MQFFPRVLAAVALSYSLNIALDLLLGRVGLSLGADSQPRVTASALIFGAHLFVAIVAGLVCAIIAGRGRTFAATLLLMAVYALDGLRVGRALAAAGHMPFSSAIVSLLCISFVPIGAILYVNRTTGSRPPGPRP